MYFTYSHTDRRHSDRIDEIEVKIYVISDLSLSKIKSQFIIQLEKGVHAKVSEHCCMLL